MIGLIPLVTAAEPEPLTPDEEFEKIKSEMEYGTFTQSGNTSPFLQSEKFNQLSPKALELYTSDPTFMILSFMSPDRFCTILDSPYLTTEDKQIFLEICMESLKWYKDGIESIFIELDQAIVIAVTKVNAMDVSEEQKSEYISELQSLQNDTEQVFSPYFSHIQEAENFLNEHEEVQTAKPIASFVDLEKDPSYYVKRYVTEPKYKDWFDRNYPDYTIWEAIGISKQQYQKIVDDLIDEPVSEPEPADEPIQKSSAFAKSS